MREFFIHTLIPLLRKAFQPDAWPAWALVLVGIWAARIGLRTLRAIEHEAKIGSEIAAAAKANATAQIIENRPWLLIDKIEVPYLTPFTEVPPEDQRMTHCIVMTKNHGKTPAKVTTLRARMEIGDNPIKPPTDLSAIVGQTPPKPEPYVFPPGEIKPAEATLAHSFITNAERSDIIERKIKYLWLMGFVKYVDTFDREPREEHETRFCFLYETRLNTPEPFWTPAGPADHNRAT
jgi:hypothetical protein